jgi:peptidoglycan L-alanyl-D-glutamate endopeptidase CwlK
MAINQSVNINQSVGRGGINQIRDVWAVQSQLNAQMPASMTRLVIDGNAGTATVAAIRNFQKLVVGVRTPDGRVDPGGKTLIALNDPNSEAKWALGASAESVEWGGDSARWTQEKKLRSLDPVFRVNVTGVIDALKNRSFHPKIFYGWRSVAVQQELVRMGRSKVKFSFHNAQKADGTPNAYAADIIDDRWGWGRPAETNGFWNALGEEAKKRGLVWGGDWTTFRDVAHIQGRRNSELAAVKRESGL